MLNHGDLISLGRANQKPTSARRAGGGRQGNSIRCTPTVLARYSTIGNSWKNMAQISASYLSCDSVSRPWSDDQENHMLFLELRSNGGHVVVGVTADNRTHEVNEKGKLA